MGECLSKGGLEAHATKSPSTKRKVPARPGHAFCQRKQAMHADLQAVTPPQVVPDFGVDGAFAAQRLLGTGQSGSAWLCQDVKTGGLVAIKFIKRPIPSAVLPMIHRECQIQAGLGDGHINLVNAREVILSRSHLGLVMEYAAGGNLADYVTRCKDTSPAQNGLVMDEEQGRFLFQQVVSAVEYLHQHHVAHRDLKLDNIVLTGDTPPRIKICDFGCANTMINTRTIVGTTEYMSPELRRSARSGRAYDSLKSEMWALGVLLYVTLLGAFPFNQDSDPADGQAGLYEWMEDMNDSWRESRHVANAITALSPECCDLLDKIFVQEESKRITLQGIKAHPWFTRPLTERYLEAMSALHAEQARVDELHRDGHYESEHRDNALDQLLSMAGVAAGPSDQHMHRVLVAKQGSYAGLSGLASNSSFGQASTMSPAKTAKSQLLDLFVTVDSAREQAEAAIVKGATPGPPGGCHALKQDGPPVQVYACA